MSVTLKVILSDRPKKDGTYPVLLRVTVNRATRKPGLGIFIKEKDFNPDGTYEKKNWIKTRNEDYDHYNKQIRGIIKKVRKRILKAQLNEQEVTPDSVRDMVNQVLAGKKDHTEIISFTEFFKKVMAEYLPDQVGSHVLFERCLYCLTCYAGEDIRFHQLDDRFVTGFFKYLTTQYKSPKHKGPLSVNSANAYIARLGTVVERAKKTIVLIDGKRTPLVRQENDPFLDFKKTKPLEPMVEILGREEMALIEDMELPKGSKIWHARNVFLMQYYMAGSRISDALLLAWEKVDEFRVEYYSLKTKTLHSIKAHDKILGILSQYEKGEGYIFPYFKNGVDYSNKKFAKKERQRHTQIINYYLRRIAKKLGISKHIHSHVSRHSFASGAILAGTPIFNVSKAIGHSKTTTTENYANRIKQTVSDSAIDSVFKKNVVELLPQNSETEEETAIEGGEG